MEANLYFKQNVVVEPLFFQWYAWPYLISPASAAMYIANSHIKIMRSFISSAQMHVSALKNPAMRGGPFINYDANRVSEVKTLLERTTKEQAIMLELAALLQSFDERLQSEADGFSLEAMYKHIPETLRGYVELVYDLNNHPSIRFIEGLLYKSPFYNRDWQSVSLFSIDNDDRSFVFSTPRLSEEHRLQLNIAFDNPALDELFKMIYKPQPLAYIKEVMKINNEHDSLFSTFFSEQSPPPPEKYSGDQVRIRYLGHACVLIETKDICLLSDPVIGYNFDGAIDRYTHLDLPEMIDYVFITHSHADHTMFETLLRLRPRIKNIIVPKSNGDGLIDPSLKLVLKNIGFKNVFDIEEMESIEFADGNIMGLPFLGEHGDLNIRSKMAYLVTVKGHSILLAADSNNIDGRLYEHIHNLVGDIDVVFIGMECEGAPLSWIFGPLMTRPLLRKYDQSRRLDGSNYQKAIGIVEQLHPKQVYVYAMGQEPWLTYVTSIKYTEKSIPIVESTKLVEDCLSRGIISERLFCRKEIFL